MPYYGDKSKILIDWIDSVPGKREEFQNGFCPGQTIEQYISMYAYIPDVLNRIATDLEAPLSLLEKLGDV